MRNFGITEDWSRDHCMVILFQPNLSILNQVGLFSSLSEVDPTLGTAQQQSDRVQVLIYFYISPVESQTKYLWVLSHFPSYRSLLIRHPTRKVRLRISVSSVNQELRAPTFVPVHTNQPNSYTTTKFVLFSFDQQLILRNPIYFFAHPHPFCSVNYIHTPKKTVEIPVFHLYDFVWFFPVLEPTKMELEYILYFHLRTWQVVSNSFF